MLAASVEESTDTVYEKGKRYFELLLNKLNIPLKASSNNIALYIAIRFQSGVQLSTLTGELCGIYHYYPMDKKDIYFDYISKLKKGYDKLRKTNLKIRAAFSINQLIQACKYIIKNGHTLQALTYQLALVLSFWCLLRSAEYTYSSNNQRVITNKDVSFKIHNGIPYVTIRLMNPKTAKQSFQDVSASCKCKISPIICPYHLLYDYIIYKHKIIPFISKPNNSLLIVPNPYNKQLKYSPLRYDVWLSFIKTLSSVWNIPADLLGTHSARIAGATYLQSIGIPDAYIQYMGRWKSTCWKLYIRAADSMVLHYIDKKIDDVDSYPNVSSDKLIHGIFNKQFSLNKSEPPDLIPIILVKQKNFKKKK